MTLLCREQNDVKRLNIIFVVPLRAYIILMLYAQNSESLVDWDVEVIVNLKKKLHTNMWIVFNHLVVRRYVGKCSLPIASRISLKFPGIVCYSFTLSVQVSNIERPPEYESAIRSKERAREDIQVRMLIASLFGHRRYLTWINKYELKNEVNKY